MFFTLLITEIVVVYIKIVSGPFSALVEIKLAAIGGSKNIATGGNLM